MNFILITVTRSLTIHAHEIDHLRKRLNFDRNKSRQKFHHSLKEHHKISNIPISKVSLRNVVKCG